MFARSLSLSLLLLLLLPSLLTGKEREEKEARELSSQPVSVSTNFGAKAGFTAALSLLNDFTIGGLPIEQVQNNYKVGYFASLFMRVNFGKHFLQPEVSYNVNQCSVSFNKPMQQEESPDGTVATSMASIESKINSIDIPVIYGYNFIKQGPYAMSVFGGPKIRYIWRHKSEVQFHNFDQQGIRERLRPLNLSFTMGVAVTISRIFFDFRYDLGLGNLSESVTCLPPAEGEPDNTISYRRRDNILSFSLGVFF